MAIRSGRFRLRALTNVVQDGEGAFYRILNSSDDRPLASGALRSFDVRVKSGGGAGAKVKLNPRFSLDVKLAGGLSDLEITPTTTGAEGEVEGIYDLLRPDQDIRSGRFRFETPIADRHQIIAAGGSGLDAVYRVYNSGKYDISLFTGPSGASFMTVPPDQSRDFRVQNRDIFVHGAGSFEGIYELVYVN